MIGSSVSRAAAITIACALGVGVAIAQTPQAPAAPAQGRGGGTPPLLMTTTAFEDGASSRISTPRPPVRTPSRRS
jgi:hypothetical protein